MKKLVKACLAFGLLFNLAACGSNESSESSSSVAEDDSSQSAEVITVKVGVVGAYNDQWDTVNELLKDEGIQVELVYFNDYATPNRALNDGDIDMNAFQHHAYLDNEVEECGYDIVSIGDTLIAPLGVFNNKDKISSVDEFKDGDIIAIPSDATNGGRALKILEEIGLIECDPEAGYLPTVADITKYNVQIEIQELESGMLASILPDVTAALINGGNAFTAGLSPIDDTIYIETIGDDVDRLKNCLVVRTEDKDNEVYLKVLEAYQTDEVAQTLQDAFNGAFLPAWK